MPRTRRSPSGRRRVIEQTLWALLLVLVVFEAYLLLPPGIPWITSPDPVPMRWRLANYAFSGLSAYSLYAYGFSLIDSLSLGFLRLTLSVYLIFDYVYDVPLTF